MGYKEKYNNLFDEYIDLKFDILKFTKEFEAKYKIKASEEFEVIKHSYNNSSKIYETNIIISLTEK